MTVFKGYMKIIKSCLPVMCLYFFIFMAITLVIQGFSKKKTDASFEEERLKVGIINQDHTKTGEALIDYIAQKHDVIKLKDDKSAIQEALFYRRVVYVLTIPEDFETKCLEQGNKLKTTQIPDSYYGFYVDQLIDAFLNNTATYRAAGYSVEEAVEMVKSQAVSDTDVTIRDVNGNNGQVPGYIYMLRFAPYLFIGVLSFCISIVLLIFRGSEIKRRMWSSPVPLRRQNMSGLLALGVVALGFLVALLIMVTLIYPEFWQAVHLGYLLGNILLLMMATIGISFLIGMTAKNLQIVSSITNVISLGICFLCGVFVPLEMLGSGVEKFSKFLPVYWYEVNMNLLADHGSLTDVLKIELYKGYAIQFAFAAACLAFGLAISKLRVQDK